MIAISLNRYFVLDFETGILQYFVNEQSKNQKPRGTLSLAGAIISPSDEVPHMLVVYSANGEIFKLRGTVLLKVPAELFSLFCLCLFSHFFLTSLYCHKVHKGALWLCCSILRYKTQCNSNLELSTCEFTTYKLSGLEDTSGYVL